MNFSDLGLSARVLQAVDGAGYTVPTPIQEQAIPHVMQRRDVLGIAQTGTGKTAAFTLPMISLLEQGRARARMPRTLILEPTRELAAQVEESFLKYSVGQKLSVALVIGGVSFDDQDVKITRGVDVLIATPGRLLDHFERGKLLLTGVEVLVIDEADRMLDMGFIPDIERIAKLCPFTRQTLFFTATMPPEIQRITEQFLHNPVRIEVSRPATAATTITQQFIGCGSKDFEKRDVLRTLIRSTENFKNAIIFCNRKRDVATLHKSLEKHAFSVTALHGDMDQRARMAALESFRNGSIQLLVASDVAARGLDIPDVSHIFNFDVPIHADDYVHRIGRTGRAGKTGHSITIATRADQKYVAAIEALLSTKAVWLEALPAASEDDGHDTRRGGRSPRREGGRGESRRGGGRSRSDAGKPEHARSAEAAPAPTPVPMPEQALESRGSRLRQRHRPETAEADTKPAQRERHRPEAAEADAGRPAASAAGAKPPETASPPRERQRNAGEDGPSVKGLGDHVPSFMMRPTRVARSA